MPIVEVAGAAGGDLSPVLTRLSAAELAITALGGGSGGTGSRLVPLYVFIGESNAGGQAALSDLSSDEKAARLAVQILNNTSLAFEALHIGVNNNIGHFDLAPNSTHGWEAGLATDVEADDYLTGTAYLVKAGQGGSTLAQWADDGEYFATFLTRVRAAVSLLRGAGLIPVVYVWQSHGINDRLAGTPIPTWKNLMIDLHERIRRELGYVPVVMTKLMALNNSAFNTAMAEIAAANPATFTVETEGLGLQDGNHWNSAAMKTIATRMGAVSRAWGEVDGYPLGQAKALATAAGAVLTPTPPGGPVAPGTWTDATWTSPSNATDIGGGILERIGGVAGSGAIAASGIAAGAPWGYEVRTTPNVNGSIYTVIYVDDSSDLVAPYTSPRTFRTAMLVVAGGLHVISDSTASNNVASIADGDIFRGFRDGNDMIYQKSTDTGSTWTTVYTHTGVLVGATTLDVRAFWAATNGGTQRIRVRTGL
jgi:hypothetical protein